MKVTQILTGCLLFFVSTANAQLDLVKDAAKLIVKTHTAPWESARNGIDVIRGKKPFVSILEPHFEVVQTTTKLVPAVVRVAHAPQNYVLGKTIDVATRVGGRKAGEVVALGAAPYQYASGLEYSVAHNVNNTAHGKNPLEMSAAPLATALRVARERHRALSKPIPLDVKNALSDYFDTSTLDRARYTVGHVEVTVPNITNKFQKYACGVDGHAVVVGEVIVFSQKPGTSCADLAWWAHEMTHVVQYKKLGYETFAYEYMTNHHAIEKEADVVKNRFLASCRHKR